MIIIAKVVRQPIRHIRQSLDTLSNDLSHSRSAFGQVVRH